MTKINLQLFGGRGASSGIRATTGPSALEAFKENSNQFSKALREGKARRAAVVEFSDITGKVVKRYWDGSTYRDRPNSERTPSERRANASKAGKASGKARRAKRTMREVANLIRFHDLRQSCANLPNANGCSLKDIQEWLGHSGIQTTANIYTHLNIERKASIMETMEKTISL